MSLKYTVFFFTQETQPCLCENKLSCIHISTNQPWIIIWNNSCFLLSPPPPLLLGCGGGVCGVGLNDHVSRKQVNFVHNLAQTFNKWQALISVWCFGPHNAIYRKFCFKTFEEKTAKKCREISPKLQKEMPCHFCSLKQWKEFKLLCSFGQAADWRIQPITKEIQRVSQSFRTREKATLIPSV